MLLIIRYEPIIINTAGIYKESILFNARRLYNAIKHPITVIGTPVKQPSNSAVLYLASLYAPHIGNSNNNISPRLPFGPKC